MSGKRKLAPRPRAKVLFIRLRAALGALSRVRIGSGTPERPPKPLLQPPLQL